MTLRYMENGLSFTKIMFDIVFLKLIFFNILDELNVLDVIKMFLIFLGLINKDKRKYER